MDKIEPKEFRQVPVESRHHHDKPDRGIQQMLGRCKNDGREEPTPLAKGMSRMETNAMLTMKPGDRAIAYLMPTIATWA